MDLTPFVTSLRRDLLSAAEGGSPEVTEAAERLARALDPASRLALLDALGAGVLELNAALAAQADVLRAEVAADLRLRGRDPEVVLDVLPRSPAVAVPGAGGPGAGGPANDPEVDGEGVDGTEGADTEDGAVLRVTLRIPESLKVLLDAAAAASGSSLNAWLVRTLAEVVRGGEGWGWGQGRGPRAPRPPRAGRGAAPGGPGDGWRVEDRPGRRPGTRVRGWVR